MPIQQTPPVNTEDDTLKSNKVFPSFKSEFYGKTTQIKFEDKKFSETDLTEKSLEIKGLHGNKKSPFCHENEDIINENSGNVNKCLKSFESNL